jgi:hypothetical protein
VPSCNDRVRNQLKVLKHILHIATWKEPIDMILLHLRCLEPFTRVLPIDWKHVIYCHLKIWN